MKLYQESVKRGGGGMAPGHGSSTPKGKGTLHETEDTRRAQRPACALDPGSGTIFVLLQPLLLASTQASRLVRRQSSGKFGVARRQNNTEEGVCTLWPLLIHHAYRSALANEDLRDWRWYVLWGCGEDR